VNLTYLYRDVLYHRNDDLFLFCEHCFWKITISKTTEELISLLSFKRYLSLYNANIDIENIIIKKLVLSSEEEETDS